MSEEIIILIAAIYASIVTVSYKKTGFVQALFWPINIIILGTYIYFLAILQEDQPPEE